MNHARSLEPLVAIDLVIADDVPDTVGKDFGSAAGHGVDASFLETVESLRDTELGATGEKGDLHHGERLDVNLRKALLQSAYEIEEIFERQIGVQSADDV